MARVRCLAFLVALFVPIAGAPPAAADDGPPPDLTGSLAKEGDVEVLRLWGTPRERGFAHGWLLAEDVLEGADKSLSMFFGERMALYDALMLPLARTAFRFSDDERAEIEGILEGIEARIPEEEKRTLKSIGRAPRIDDLLLINVFGDVYALGCSSLAVWGKRTADGQTLVVRNFDFPALDLVVSHQHVRVVAPGPDTKGYVAIAYPGGIGVLTALNEAGVFVAIHDVHVTPGMQDMAQGNVPRLVALRRLMETLDAEGAVEKATELCRGWNTLYGNNFMVATSSPAEGRAAGVLEYDTREADDQGVDLRAAADGDEHVMCTNHHRTRGTGDCWRYDTLTGACRDDDPTPVTVEELFALAGRISFPKPDETIERGRLGTLHQVVAETGAKRLHVRMASFGGNIRSEASVVFDVAEVLATSGASEDSR